VTSSRTANVKWSRGHSVIGWLAALRASVRLLSQAIQLAGQRANPQAAVEMLVEHLFDPPSRDARRRALAALVS
jgi:hypothetical protein